MQTNINGFNPNPPKMKRKIWIASMVLAFIITAGVVYAKIPNELEQKWIDYGASSARLDRIEADASQIRLESAQRLSKLGKDWNQERATLDEIMARIASFQ